MRYDLRLSRPSEPRTVPVVDVVVVVPAVLIVGITVADSFSFSFSFSALSSAQYRDSRLRCPVGEVTEEVVVVVVVVDEEVELKGSSCLLPNEPLR